MKLFAKLWGEIGWVWHVYCTNHLTIHCEDGSWICTVSKCESGWTSPYFDEALQEYMKRKGK